MRQKISRTWNVYVQTKNKPSAVLWSRYYSKTKVITIKVSETQVKVRQVHVSKNNKRVSVCCRFALTRGWTLTRRNFRNFYQTWVFKTSRQLSLHSQRKHAAILTDLPAYWELMQSIKTYAIHQGIALIRWGVLWSFELSNSFGKQEVIFSLEESTHTGCGTYQVNKITAKFETADK